MLTVGQADRLRTSARATLAEFGYEVDMYGDHARTAGGAQYGLWNLASRVAHEPERRWGRIVREHFRVLTEAMTQAMPEPSEEQLESDLLVRLVETSSLSGGQQSFDYALEWMPGVSRVLVIDEPQTVRTLMDQVVARLGPVGPLLDRGHRNLVRMLREARVTVERFDIEDGHVHVAMSDNVYLASMAQCLDEAVRHWSPGADLAHGVVFAIPFRNQVVFRVIDGSDSVLHALVIVPRLALAGYAEGTGPISPHTYLWLDGEVTQLTELGGDEIVVRPGPLERWLSEEP